MTPDGSSTWGRSPRRSRRPCASATSSSRRRCPWPSPRRRGWRTGTTPGLEQEALADLIESGAYERHVRRVRRRNGERRAALLAALSATLGDAVTVVGADAGLHVVVWLNRVPRAREDALVARAHAAGLGVYPVTPLYAPAPASSPARHGRAGDGVRQPRRAGHRARRADARRRFSKPSLPKRTRVAEQGQRMRSGVSILTS